MSTKTRRLHKSRHFQPDPLSKLNPIEIARLLRVLSDAVTKMVEGLKALPPTSITISQLALDPYRKAIREHCERQERELELPPGSLSRQGLG